MEAKFEESKSSLKIPMSDIRNRKYIGQQKNDNTFRSRAKSSKYQFDSLAIFHIQSKHDTHYTTAVTHSI